MTCIVEIQQQFSDCLCIHILLVKVRTLLKDPPCFQKVASLDVANDGATHVLIMRVIVLMVAIWMFKVFKKAVDLHCLNKQLKPRLGQVHGIKEH